MLATMDYDSWKGEEAAEDYHLTIIRMSGKSNLEKWAIGKHDGVGGLHIAVVTADLG